MTSLAWNFKLKIPSLWPWWNFEWMDILYKINVKKVCTPLTSFIELSYKKSRVWIPKCQNIFECTEGRDTFPKERSTHVIAIYCRDYIYYLSLQLLSAIWKLLLSMKVYFSRQSTFETLRNSSHEMHFFMVRNSRFFCNTDHWLSYLMYQNWRWVVSSVAIISLTAAVPPVNAGVARRMTTASKGLKPWKPSRGKWALTHKRRAEGA